MHRARPCFQLRASHRLLRLCARASIEAFLCATPLALGLLWIFVSDLWPLWAVGTGGYFFLAHEIHAQEDDARPRSALGPLHVVLAAVVDAALQADEEGRAWPGDEPGDELRDEEPKAPLAHPTPRDAWVASIASRRAERLGGLRPTPVRSSSAPGPAQSAGENQAVPRSAPETEAELEEEGPLEAAEDASSPRPPSPATVTTAPGTEVAATPMEPALELLGPVRLAGARKVRRPKKATELVAWLNLHPEGAELEELARVLWPDGSKSHGHLYNTVSEARRLLGPGPGGRPRIPRGERHLRLEPPVASDWVRFASLAAGDDPGSWHEALALVRGRPLSGVEWPWASALASEIEGAVVDLACRVAEAAFEAGDVSEAAWATGQGLLASPSDGRLRRLAVRARDEG
jgi:hypothetical protein